MKSTKNIKIPEKLIDQVIGQEEAIEVVKKAALQRRHVLLIGEPGVGKSMLGVALSELLPKSVLKDMLAYPNPNDENEPLIKEVKAGQGKPTIQRAQMDGKQVFKNTRLLMFILAIAVMIAPWWARSHYGSDLMFTAFFLGGMLFLVAFAFMMGLGPRALAGGGGIILPKVIVDNSKKEKAPFFDATGAHAGALLGDVLHDPLQSFCPLQVVNRPKVFTDEKKENISEMVNKSLLKHKDKLIIAKEKNYEAAFTSMNEIQAIGENKGSFIPVEVLSSNRYDFDGEMIKLTTSKNKTLTVTPEHKIAIWEDNEITYLEASKIKEKQLAATKAEESEKSKIESETITKVERFNYKGKLYNVTTESGNVLVNGILCKNSGGLGTPANQRVMAGMIHKANKGVLFIDEIATLEPRTQQELLSAIQEKTFPITGQSERSSGAMVRTQAVPCDFILIAAGNLETVRRMHPALRSRIRGYGYEIFMKETMPDTKKNRLKLARFVAQEVNKENKFEKDKIPHFALDAINEIIEEARRRASRKNALTLRLRGLGGLIRAAGDVAKGQKAEYVKQKHVIEARKLARPLEQQMADQYIERKKEYEVIRTTGSELGRVNGLAVIGSGGASSGVILPIEAEITKNNKKQNQIIATGKLGEIAKEAITNVTAIVNRLFGQDLKESNIFVQFLQTYEGVEGDSASIAVATTIISALKKIPIRQDIAMTGSLTVRGEVLPIGGVSYKIEAAIESGIKTVIVPKSNMQDIVLKEEKRDLIEIIPVSNIKEVLEHAFDWNGKTKLRKKILAA